MFGTRPDFDVSDRGANSRIKKHYTIILVTHNLEQAARCADYVGFFSQGHLVEYGRMEQLFMKPAIAQTNDYFTGGSALVARKAQLRVREQALPVR